MSGEGEGGRVDAADAPKTPRRSRSTRTDVLARQLWDAEQSLSDVRSQLQYEQANRRKFEADYRAEHLDYLAAVEAERDAALATIAAVRALHQPVQTMECDCCPPMFTCAADDDGEYPCPTIRLLDGADTGHGSTHG